MIFHAYYWMGIAFVCLCLMTAMMVWYFRQQQKRHPELVDLMADTSECELHKIQVNIYTNEIIIDGIAYPSRCQVVSLVGLPDETAHARNLIHGTQYRIQ